MKRRKFSPSFKAKVALASFKGDKSLGELSSQYQVHPNQISKWKKQLLENVATVFSDSRIKTVSQDDSALRDRLYQQIGQLQVELDWVKKKSELFD